MLVPMHEMYPPFCASAKIRDENGSTFRMVPFASARASFGTYGCCNEEFKRNMRTKITGYFIGRK